MTQTDVCLSHSAAQRDTAPARILHLGDLQTRVISKCGEQEFSSSRRTRSIEHQLVGSVNVMQREAALDV